MIKVINNEKVIFIFGVWMAHESKAPADPVQIFFGKWPFGESAEIGRASCRERV